ncbi:MAG: hypothetical protein LC744_01255, partial [Chloroflexi bacterium]|nr:hypothetical protein [Chloroflexota bacterium]
MLEVGQGGCRLTCPERQLSTVRECPSESRLVPRLLEDLDGFGDRAAGFLLTDVLLGIPVEAQVRQSDAGCRG